MKRNLRLLSLVICCFSAVFCSFSEANADIWEDLVDKSNSKRIYVQKASKVELPPPPKKKASVEEPLVKALNAHNLIVTLDGQSMRADDLKEAQKKVKVARAVFDNFETCNINRLSSNFQDADAVWKKLTEALEEHVQEYNFATTSKIEEVSKDEATLLAQLDEAKKADAAQPLIPGMPKEAITKTEEVAKNFDVDLSAVKMQQENERESEEATHFTNDDVKKIMPDANATWMAGYVVLNKFYADQDKWGKRQRNSASLPIWEDQKYLYKRDIWDKKYEEINNRCRKNHQIELLVKEPIIDDRKYDYYFYDDVVAAHKAFLIKAAKQGCIVDGDLRDAPKAAPRPLPPVEENILAMTTGGDGTDFSSVYPQNPMNPNPKEIGSFIAETLWEKYKKENYTSVKKDGEFDTYFEVKGSAVRKKDVADSIQDNRLSYYFKLKEELKNAQESYNRLLESQKELAEGLLEATETADSGFTFSEKTNYFDKDTLKRLRKQLLSVKNKNVKLLRERLGNQAENITSMSAEEIQKHKNLLYLKALEYDKDALVTITGYTAADIEEQVKKAKANQELLRKMKDEARSVTQSDLDKLNRPFDASCLKQTDGVLVSF